MSPITKRKSAKTKQTRQGTSDRKGTQCRAAKGGKSAAGKGRARRRKSVRTKAKTAPAADTPLRTRALTEKEVQTLWRRLKKRGDRRARNRLLVHYLPLIRYAAEHVRTRLPREIDPADLESAGFFGLHDAIRGFDLSRRVKFETYCGPRIRGAILDELRSLDWVPRLVRARANRLETARSALEIEFGRQPNPREIAKKLGCSVKEYIKLTREASTVGVFHVAQNPQDEESGRGIHEIEGLQDHNGEDPGNRTQRDDLRELIIKGLSKKERLIIVLYYYEEMTMREIGHSLGLSESRVSQMHAAILGRLKKNLAERRQEFDLRPVAGRSR